MVTGYVVSRHEPRKLIHYSLLAEIDPYFESWRAMVERKDWRAAADSLASFSNPEAGKFSNETATSAILQTYEILAQSEVELQCRFSLSWFKENVYINKWECKLFFEFLLDASPEKHKIHEMLDISHINNDIDLLLFRGIWRGPFERVNANGFCFLVDRHEHLFSEIAVFHDDIVVLMPPEDITEMEAMNSKTKKKSMQI